jgi:hypothetical protein
VHTKRTRAESFCSKQGKLDTLVWQTGGSGFVRSGGNQGHCRLWRGRPSPDQVVSDQWEGQDPQKLKELWRRLVDVYEVKTKRKENQGKSMKRIILIDCVDNWLQSAVTYVYIGSRTQLFESDTRKSFLNKLNLKP